MGVRGACLHAGISEGVNTVQSENSQRQAPLHHGKDAGHRHRSIQRNGSFHKSEGGFLQLHTSLGEDSKAGISQSCCLHLHCTRVRIGGDVQRDGPELYAFHTLELFVAHSAAHVEVQPLEPLRLHQHLKIKLST